jgi:hypothetical protein
MSKRKSGEGMSIASKISKTGTTYNVLKQDSLSRQNNFMSTAEMLKQN